MATDLAPGGTTTSCRHSRLLHAAEQGSYDEGVGVAAGCACFNVFLQCTALPSEDTMLELKVRDSIWP